MSGPGEITRLLAERSSEDLAALDHLVPIVYDELRRLAPGGSLNPGSRNARNAFSILPLSIPSARKTLAQLAGEGVVTPPLTLMPEFICGGTTANLPARASDPMPPDASEFSQRDASIYSMWAKKRKLSKCEIT